MIKIDNKNKSAIIHFNNLVYDQKSIEQSLKDFKEFFSFSLDSDNNSFIANINFNDKVLEENYRKTCLELCNYIFILMRNKINYEIQN